MRLPRAVVVVDMFGQAADLSPIRELCQRYELPLLEDAAEALGARYRGHNAGTLADAGVFSFNGNKIITSSGGGMLVSPNETWIEKARYWSMQSSDPDPVNNNYLHTELGYNYRMSNILAGVALGQLAVLETRIQQRRAVFERYRKSFEQLPGIEPQPEVLHTLAAMATAADLPSSTDARPSSRHTRWLSCFLVEEAKFGMSAGDLIRFLDLANIEARPVWKPMHTQPLYRDYERVGGEVAEDLNQRGICLPSSSSLTEDEQQFVIDRVREAHENSGP
jgi:pyridoxal phosphate-dependent aminotransferase EpsN